MKKHLPLVLSFILLAPAVVRSHFDRSTLGTRSQALGGAFVALADDASALYLNPAGLVSFGCPALYADYAGRSGRSDLGEAKAGVVVPLGSSRFGAGWYRFGFDGDVTENLFVACAARKLLEGTQGSFVSVGTGMRVGTLSRAGACACGSHNAVESDVTWDVGVMVRPLPVLSFGYAIENVREGRFDLPEPGTRWNRVNRWGISYFWEERVIVSFEQEHAVNEVIRHYGFSLRTAYPLEIMAGFSEERISGGVRLLSDRIRVSAAFASDDDLGITTRAAVEILLQAAGAAK